jgi:hypothetical protein
LGRDSTLRAQEKARLTPLCATLPSSDTAKYAAKVMPVLDGLVADWNTRTSALLKQQPDRLVKQIADLDVGKHAVGSTAHEIIEEVVLPYLRSGGSRRMLDIGAQFGSTARPFLDEGWQGVLFEADARYQPRLDALTSEYPGQIRLETAHVGRSEDIASVDGSHVDLSAYIAQMGLGDADFIRLTPRGGDLECLRGLASDIVAPRLMMVEFEALPADQLRIQIDAFLFGLDAKAYKAVVCCHGLGGGSVSGTGKCGILSVAVGAMPNVPVSGPLDGTILIYAGADHAFLPSFIDWLRRKVVHSQDDGGSGEALIATESTLVG